MNGGLLSMCLSTSALYLSMRGRVIHSFTWMYFFLLLNSFTMIEVRIAKFARNAMTPIIPLHIFIMILLQYLIISEVCI